MSLFNKVSLAGVRLKCDKNGDFRKPSVGIYSGQLINVTIQGSTNNKTQGFKLEYLLDDGAKCHDLLWFMKSNGQLYPDVNQAIAALAIKFGYTEEEITSDDFKMPVVSKDGTLTDKGFFGELIEKEAKVEIELEVQKDKDGIEHEKGYLRTKRISKLSDHIDVVDAEDQQPIVPEKQAAPKKRKTKVTESNGYESGTDTSTANNNNNNNNNSMDESDNKPIVKAPGKKRVTAKKSNGNTNNSVVQEA